MSDCLIPRESCVKYFHNKMNDDVLNCDFNDFILFKINTNLFYLKSMACATQNRLACHFGHACHRFASADLEYELHYKYCLTG